MLYLMLCCCEVGINQAVMCWLNTYSCTVDSKSQMHLMCQEKYTKWVVDDMYVCVRDRKTHTHTHTDEKRVYVDNEADLTLPSSGCGVYFSASSSHNSLWPQLPVSWQTVRERDGDREERGKKMERWRKREQPTDHIMVVASVIWLMQRREGERERDCSLTAACVLNQLSIWNHAKP